MRLADRRQYKNSCGRFSRLIYLVPNTVALTRDAYTTFLMLKDGKTISLSNENVNRELQVELSGLIFFRLDVVRLFRSLHGRLVLTIR